MAFRDGVLLYREAGALPEPALRELISSIQAVNMDDIRKQIQQEGAKQN
jgi:thioredoxin 1